QHIRVPHTSQTTQRPAPNPTPAPWVPALHGTRVPRRRCAALWTGGCGLRRRRAPGGGRLYEPVRHRISIARHVTRAAEIIHGVGAQLPCLRRRVRAEGGGVIGQARMADDPAQVAEPWPTAPPAGPTPAGVGERRVVDGLPRGGGGGVP